MVLVRATILGGLPIVADVTFGKDADTPNGPGEYWAEVEALYWQKHDGTKGKEVSQAVYERCHRWDNYWQAYVTEEANEWLSVNCPTRIRDQTASGGYRNEGDWSPDYIALNGNPMEEATA